MDIHDSQMKLAALERMATHDPLTGLLNHVSAKKRIEERVEGRPDGQYGFIVGAHHLRAGNAHAQGNGELLVGAVGNGVVDPGDNGVQFAPVLQEQQELVPPHPGGDIRAADALPQLIRQEFQHLVAENMSEGIVGVLEVVQVEDSQGELPVGPALHPLFDPLLGADVVP